MKKPQILLVLGGSEKYQKARADKASELYNKYEVPIIISSSHSGTKGVKLPEGQRKECEMIAELIGDRVPKSSLILEGKSTDTLGNMLFSEELIPDGFERVGVITDKFHMQRSLYLFNKVMPDKEPIPFYSSKDRDLVESATQRIRLYATMADLRKIDSGNIIELKRYMQERNPMYNENAKFSWMGLLVNLEKKIKFLQRTKRL